MGISLVTRRADNAQGPEPSRIPGGMPLRRTRRRRGRVPDVLLGRHHGPAGRRADPRTAQDVAVPRALRGGLRPDRRGGVFTA